MRDRTWVATSPWQKEEREEVRKKKKKNWENIYEKNMQQKRTYWIVLSIETKEGVQLSSELV